MIIVIIANGIIYRLGFSKAEKQHAVLTTWQKVFLLTIITN